MPGTPPNNTLHVIGTVDAHSTELAFLRKRNPQGINKQILILDLFVVMGFVPVDNPQRVHYSENLTADNDYSSIEIYYKDKREAKIDNIPIVQ